jgi:hypothetical protein
MRFQIHVHIHIRILYRAYRLNVIQPKALGHLTKVLRRHGIQEPRYHLLDGSSLLLRQFVNHGRLRHALDVDIVRRLPRTRLVVEVGVHRLGGERPMRMMEV